MAGLLTSFVVGSGGCILGAIYAGGTMATYPLLLIVYAIIGLICGIIVLPICPIGCLVGGVGSWLIATIGGGLVMGIATFVVAFGSTYLYFGWWMDILSSPMWFYMLFSPISASLDIINILKVSINSILNLLSLE